MLLLRGACAFALVPLLVGACAGTTGNDTAQVDELGDEVAAAEPAQGEAQVPPGGSTGLLYVAQAGAATVEGQWPSVTVTLSEVDTEMLWFQDRPGRVRAR